MQRFKFVQRAMALLVLAALVVPLTAHAQPGETCETFSETGQEICGDFLTYWERNGGLPVFGLPLTPQFSELSADTMAQQEVQYYERERFEYHPANAGTPYVILLGRLGADLLAFHGIDWMTLPKADPGEAHYMAATGQAIAPEFWGYWAGHGLDFGDVGVSFRESLALFGYPVAPAEVETNADGDTVLTQWFERARFELHGDTVLLGRLGAEVNDSDEQFAIRVQIEMDAVLRKYYGEFESPGTIVSVTADGLGAWAGSIGIADPTTGAPYTDRTHQRIGSITKTFVGTLALQLVDQGLLDLDATVDQWLEGVPNGDRITVRMLLNMTSGIANYTDNQQVWHVHYAEPEKVWTQEELLAYGFELSPLFEPGAQFYYSNTNTVLLGLIIEAVTGRDLRVVLQEGILDPLGLTHTSFPADDDTSLPEPYADGITRNIFTGELLDATNWNPSWAWAAGQMISTQADLRVWVRALALGELLSPQLQAERLAMLPIVPGKDIGYGLAVERLYGWLGHSGEIDGYDSESFYRPDLGAGILVFTNSSIASGTGQSPSTTVLLEFVALLNREYPLPPAGQ